MNPRPTDKELSGMTINERLYACRLIERFEDAARQRDRVQMIAVLTEVALTPEQAAWSTDNILGDPARFGF